jgi:hypothetical protein
MSNSTLLHGGVSIPGLVLKWPEIPFDLHPYETHFAGVDGISRLEGGAGRRVLDVAIVLYNRYSSRTALSAFVNDQLNWDMVGSSHTLEYSTASPAFTAVEPDCVLEGFMQDDQIGQIFDGAGTLDGGWFCFGVLRFIQLSKGR